MKYVFSLLIGTLFITASVTAQVYVAKNSEVSFFSETVMENIEAVNKDTNSIFVLNAATNNMVSKLVMKNFKFKSPLMEEHFNENYVESHLYPTCVFKGKINEKIDYAKEGVTKVSVDGELDLHGVKKNYRWEGTVTIKDGQIILETKFKIKLVDHNIKVPSVVAQKIAEEIEVKTKATLIPFKK